MDVYATDKIRNVAVLGHGGAGKTTLVEAMAYSTGLISRMGKITDGNTISDFDKEEAKRSFSISTSVIPLEWNGVKINFLDTPGYFDFVGEVEEAMSVADTAVIVVNGKAGFEAGAQKSWNFCEENATPRMIFVTNMDDDHADFDRVVEEVKALYGSKVIPLALPIREGEKTVGYVDVVSSTGAKFAAFGKDAACDVPGDLESALESAREALMEAVAETSEELMDKYLEELELPDEDIVAALPELIASCDLVPVIFGSSAAGFGMHHLMDEIAAICPSPAVRTISGVNTKDDSEFVADYKADLPVSAKVFKTLVDPFIGKYSIFKVCSGILRPDGALYNVNKETEEKISRLYILRGKETIEVKELYAGDIGAVQKLNVTATGDTLATKADPIRYELPAISTPYTVMGYRAKNKGDEDKISQALAKIMDEDLTLKSVNDKENRQTLLYGIGEQQLDVVVSKIATRYKVDVELYKPKVAYRETLRGKVRVQGRHKKQSGGHGQFGDVHMEFEPSGDMETPYVFEEKIFGGSVPKNYFPAVEKGIQECVAKGPLAGYPVVGLKATLVDGSYHPVDSSEMAFKLATILAFKKGFMDAKPVLLEPIVSLKVIVPDKFTGDVMGDLNKRRGRVLGMNPDHKGNQIIEADIPQSELYGYSTDLRSMTGGIGSFSYEFSRYEQAPADVQQKEIEERAANAEE